MIVNLIDLCHSSAIRRTVFAWVLISLSLGASAAKASVNHDLQLWTQFFAQKKWTPTWGTYLELQPRFDRDLSRLHITILRPALYAQLNPYLTAWIGTAWIQGERRPWLQLLGQWAHGPLTLTSRLRFEFRELDATVQTSHRLRQLLRVTGPLKNDTTVYWASSAELFFHLNSIPGGPQSGFDQSRVFLGVGNKLGNGLLLEGGYLANYVDRPAPAANAMNHAAFLTLAYLR